MLPTVVRNRGLRPLARNLVLLKHSLELLANLSGRTCLLTSPLNHHIDVVEQVQHSHVSGVKDLLVVHPGPPTAYVPVGAIVLDALFAAQVSVNPRAECDGVDSNRQRKVKQEAMDILVRGQCPDHHRSKGDSS